MKLEDAFDPIDAVARAATQTSDRVRVSGYFSHVADRAAKALTAREIREIWERMRGHQLSAARAQELERRWEVTALKKFTRALLIQASKAAIEEDNGELMLETWLRRATGAVAFDAEADRAEFERDRAKRRDRLADLKPYGPCESCGFVVDDFGNCMCNKR